MELSNYQIKEGGGNGGNKEFDLVQLPPTVHWNVSCKSSLWKMPISLIHVLPFCENIFISNRDFECIMVCHVHN